MKVVLSGFFGAALPARAVKFRSIIFDKDIAEIEDIFKILELIFGGFAQDLFIDHVNDDISKVYGFSDAPVFEDHFSHGSVALQGKVFDTFRELLAGDMAGRVKFAACVLECFKYEYVCLDRVARISRNDVLKICVVALKSAISVRSLPA